MSNKILNPRRCHITGAFYSKTDRCMNCGKNIGKHFLISQMCVDCYAKNETIEMVKCGIILPDTHDSVLC